MKLVSKQRHGLEAVGNLAMPSPAGAPPSLTPLRPVAAVGGKPKRFADGGRVEPVFSRKPKLIGPEGPKLGTMPDLGTDNEPKLRAIPLTPDPRPEPKSYKRGGKVLSFR